MMVRRTFTREFKLGVCRQVVGGDVSKSQVKRQHNIGNATLDRWIAQYLTLGEESFNGSDWRPLAAEPETQVRTLEAALGRAHMEIEFLKECLGKFPRLREKKRP